MFLVEMEAALEGTQHVVGTRAWTTREGQARFKSQGGSHHGRFQRSNAGKVGSRSGFAPPAANRPWWGIRQGLLRAESSSAGDRPPAEPQTGSKPPALFADDGSPDAPGATTGNRARNTTQPPPPQDPRQ
jgi:hypothetical protein